MSERNAIAEQGPRLGQRLAHIAEDEALRRRNAVGMRGDLPLADIDVAAGEQFAQGGVRAALAKAAFEHNARQPLDQRCRTAETSTLCPAPPDGAFEAAPL